MKRLRSAGILGVGSSIPDKVLTNQDLERMVDTSDEWITTRTGIKERRIADPGRGTSHYAAAAARKAMERAGVEPADLDMIVVATVTPDAPFPATACIVQAEIGAPQAAAFDVSAGCSGFVYALDIATRGVEAGAYERVLVIGADLLSTITDFTDRSTCVLFGDGAGAAVVGPVAEGGVLSTYLGADGGGGVHLFVSADDTIPSAGAPATGEKRYIRMAGREVYKFAVTMMPEAALEALKRADRSPDEVSLFIPHQANIRIIDAAAKRLGISPDRVFVNVDRFGNTSAASIPLALDEALDQGRIGAGDLIVLVGFGAGLTWGSAAIVWSGERIGRD